MTLLRFRYMEYDDVKANTRKDIYEWIIDGHIPGADLERLKELRLKQDFIDDSSLPTFIKEKKEFFNKTRVVFSRACESEFGYF